MPTSSTLAARRDAANNRLQAGAYDAALRLYESILKETPDDPNLLNDMGLAYAQKGNLGQATDCFRQALHLQPDYDTAFFNLLDVVEEHEGRAAAGETFRTHHTSIPENDEKNQYRQRLLSSDPNASSTSNGHPVSEAFAQLERAHAACARYDVERCQQILPEVKAGIQALPPTASPPDLTDHLHHARQALHKNNIHQAAAHFGAMGYLLRNQISTTAHPPDLTDREPRVLLFGSLSTTFIPPLVEQLKAHWPHQSYAMGLCNPDESPIRDEHADLFEGLYSYPAFSSNPLLFTDLCEYHEFDLYHVHFLHPNFLKSLSHVPSNKPVILSIWGSDLFRAAGPKVYKTQYQAFQRADLITIHNPEMREIFLSKFGRDLKPKIHYTRFLTDTDIYRTIDRLDRAEARMLLNERYGIDPDQTIVCAGHNAGALCQHEAILRQLATLPPDYRNRIAVVLPMTYKKDATYLNHIRSVAEDLDIDIHLITKYMSTEAVGQLRLSSDLFIHVPETDAFSGAMCETLYAGNPVITGTWLPYGRLRTNDVHYHEVSVLDELPERTRSVLGQLDQEREKASDNPAIIQSLLDPTAVTTEWTAAYERVLNG